MAKFYKVALYFLSLIISMISLIVISSVSTKLHEYKLKINQLAFFRLEKILVDQIPSYQALVFAVYIPFCVYYVWNYILERKRSRRIQNGEATFEEKYFLDVETQESKQWSNILLTNLFIYLTQALALFLAIFFCSYAIGEIQYVQGQYDSTSSESDRDTVESVVDLKDSLKATIALDVICLVQIFFVSIENCFTKIMSK